MDELDKTFVAIVNNGKLAVDPDVLYKVLNLPMTCSTPKVQSISQEEDVNADSFSTYSYNLSENYPQRNFSERKSIDEMSAQNSQQLVLWTRFSERPPPVVVLRSFVCHGEISYREEHVQIWDPKFQVPDNIKARLLDGFRNEPLVGIRIIKFSNGSTEFYVDQNLKQFTLGRDIQLDTGKKLLLKTRVDNGKVSFEDNDVKYKLLRVIPKCIIEDLERMKADGDLYITLRDPYKFEVIIKRSGKMEQAFNAATSVFKQTREATKKGFRSLRRNSKN